MNAQISVTLFTLLFLLLLPQHDSNSQKKIYRPMGHEATLVGTITFIGKIPEPRHIDMSADPVCAAVNPDALTENVVTTGDKLQNVFVYFKSGNTFNQYTFEQPDTPAVLKHDHCFYRPLVLGIRVKQPLQIENHDRTVHNTHPTPRTNREWNYSQAPNSPPLIKMFEYPEVMIPFKCNQHPWEKAYVAVFDHPFFNTSDVYGRYEIRGVPPGTYKIVARHETLGQQEIEITLTAGEVRTFDFVFGRESY